MAPLYRIMGVFKNPFLVKSLKIKMMNMKLMKRLFEIISFDYDEFNYIFNLCIKIGL